MREITYGSVCSGIEAATTAWHPLGWSPRWFAEIEPFPSAVLAHHWPEVPNLGDFTLIRDRIMVGEVDAPDVLVGGMERPAGNANELDFCVPVNGSHWDGDYAHPTLNQSAKGSGGVGGSNQEIFSQRGAYLVPQDAPQVFGGNRCSGPIDIAPASGRLDFESEAFAVSFSCKDHGGDAGEIAPTMRSMGHHGSHANGGGQLAGGIGYSTETAPTLTSADSGSNRTPTAQVGMQVRRLTPTEAERLQGFPDGHTRIPWRGKPAEECPDGPRYKALGNSMAVPVMRWIGARIKKQMDGQNG